jgi:hypothetical protein
MSGGRVNPIDRAEGERNSDFGACMHLLGAAIEPGTSPVVLSKAVARAVCREIMRLQERVVELERALTAAGLLPEESGASDAVTAPPPGGAAGP